MEGLEIVFISSDRSEEDMSSYMKESHGDWLAVAHNSNLANDLKQKYGGIWTLRYNYNTEHFRYLWNPILGCCKEGWKFDNKGWKITCDKQEPSTGCSGLETVKIRRTPAFDIHIDQHLYPLYPHLCCTRYSVWLNILFSDDFDYLEWRRLVIK